jgi:hypothetical protein
MFCIACCLEFISLNPAKKISYCGISSVAMIARNWHARTNPAGWKYLYLGSKCC